MLRLALIALLGLSALPGRAPAAEEKHLPPLDVPVWSAAPFVLLLLAIAVLPLAAGHFWHANRNKALVALLFALPVACYLAVTGPIQQADVPALLKPLADSGPPWLQETVARQGTHSLLHALAEYASFIILLASLYTVSGGIVLRGDVRARPITNTAILGAGAALANLIGTTGASMLLIRPVLRINQQREHTRHLPIFFIFTVSNLGGLLTPLGDPPLFLGFLRGVGFFWTFQLWPQWLVANGAVLGVFLVWDTIAYFREPQRAIVEDIREREPLRVEGLRNLLFLAGIVAAVLFQSEAVGRSAGAWLGQFFHCPDLTLSKPWGEVMMVGMAVLAYGLTPGRLRWANGFSWGPILEVAILFAGIFVCMVPALELLRQHSDAIRPDPPWQYFWLTGGLSSFLDNAPTYLTLATMAAGHNPISWLVENRPLVLQAISCGAVFMGANTYIGNGPNFMVKAIADEAGLQAPSFFGYMAYSGLILLPIFGLITYLFFWPA